MRYTKKPVTIEAWRNTPDTPRPSPAWLDDALARKAVRPSPHVVGALDITTLEGVMRADVGDWVIRGLMGELYPCKPDIFNATYELAWTDSFDFGRALAALKAGKRVRRAGWNGKGMWLALTEGSERVVRDGKFNGAAAQLVTAEAPEVVRIGAHIDMRAADGSLVIGWLASQTDMLATDWELVE